MENKTYSVLAFLVILVLLFSCDKKMNGERQVNKQNIFYENEINSNIVNIPSIVLEQNSNNVNNNLKNILDILTNEDIKKINGTWVGYESLLRSPRFQNFKYSWGNGKTIVDSSLDFDLEINKVYLLSYGGYLIDSVYKSEKETIHMKLFSISDKERKFPEEMKISFIDDQRVFITYTEFGRIDKTLSLDEPWVWYRLSGPE